MTKFKMHVVEEHDMVSTRRDYKEGRDMGYEHVGNGKAFVVVTAVILVMKI